eukprot:jgi/Mesen1/6895/ME000353S05915
MSKELAKELAIRKRILSIYNKRREDFASLKLFNDFLEEVEDTIFNLVQGVDVAETEERVRAYQAANQDQIIDAQARKAEEAAAAIREHHQQQALATGPPSQAPPGGGNGIGGGPAAQAGAPQGYAPTMAPGGMMAPRPVGMQPTPVSQDIHGVHNGGQASPGRRARAARAGGWLPEMAARRAVEEAFLSLWVN